MSEWFFENIMVIGIVLSIIFHDYLDNSMYVKKPSTSG